MLSTDYLKAVACLYIDYNCGISPINTAIGFMLHGGNGLPTA
jgi:hypothetical protein